MAHFCKIENNVIKQIIVIANEAVENKEFPESEPIGIELCKSIYGEDTEWVQCSYNANFRGVYPGVNMIYDPVLDIFKEPEQKA